MSIEIRMSIEILYVDRLLCPTDVISFSELTDAYHNAHDQPHNQHAMYKNPKPTCNEGICR